MKRFARVCWKSLMVCFLAVGLEAASRMWLFATDRVVRSIADAHAAIVESVATSAGFVRPEADLSETDAYLLAEKECIRRGRAPVRATRRW